MILEKIVEKITEAIIDATMENTTGMMFGMTHGQGTWDGLATSSKIIEPLFTTQIANVITARITIHMVSSTDTSWLEPGRSTGFIYTFPRWGTEIMPV